jgi:hypothetical protein
MNPTDTFVSVPGSIINLPPFPSDTAKIIYDDSVSIMHYRAAVQIATRSILIADSRSGNETGQYHYL